MTTFSDYPDQMADIKKHQLLVGVFLNKIDHGATPFGVLTKQFEALTNDFFINLLDMGTQWKPSKKDKDIFVGLDKQGAHENGWQPLSTWSSSLIQNSDPWQKSMPVTMVWRNSFVISPPPGTKSWIQTDSICSNKSFITIEGACTSNDPAGTDLFFCLSSDGIPILHPNDGCFHHDLDEWVDLKHGPDTKSVSACGVKFAQKVYSRFE